MRKQKKEEKMRGKAEISGFEHADASRELIALVHKSKLHGVDSCGLTSLDVSNSPMLQRMARSYPESTVHFLSGIPILNVHLT